VSKLETNSEDSEKRVLEIVRNLQSVIDLVPDSTCGVFTASIDLKHIWTESRTIEKDRNSMCTKLDVLIEQIDTMIAKLKIANTSDISNLNFIQSEAKSSKGILKESKYSIIELMTVCKAFNVYPNDVYKIWEKYSIIDEKR
jgi:hypothetical protein